MQGMREGDTMNLDSRFSIYVNRLPQNASIEKAKDIRLEKLQKLFDDLELAILTEGAEGAMKKFINAIAKL